MATPRVFVYYIHMTLEAKIKSDFITAFKARNAEVADTLRMLQSALHNRIIEKKGKGEEATLSDEEVLEIIRRESKKRKEAANLFTEGGRADLAEKELKELKILEVYLPAQMSEEDIRKEVAAVIASMGPVDPKDFGKVMGAVMKQLKGKADAGLANKILKEQLK